MRFLLIDRIVEIEPGRRMTAVKNLSLAEEYLGDHFPLFPVMPGVMMLEAMTQAAAWLIRASEDFAHSHVLLHEARNVKYSEFVEPGQTLSIVIEIVKQDERYVQVKAVGTVGEKNAVQGRLTLERYNLADDDPDRRPQDDYAVRSLRDTFALIYPEAIAAAD